MIARVKHVLSLAVLMLFSMQVAAQETGQEREPFDDRYCMTCHGIDGVGNFGVQAPRLAGMEPWYLERQLKLFRDGLRGKHPEDTEGLAMQPMAVLTDESITDIVAWVGTWEYKPAPATITAGDKEHGESLYQTCATCHGINAEGNESMNAPALAGQNDWYLVTQLQNFKAGYRGYRDDDVYGSQMRQMSGVLQTRQDIIDVVSYINTLRRL